MDLSLMADFGPHWPFPVSPGEGKIKMGHCSILTYIKRCRHQVFVEALSSQPKEWNPPLVLLEDLTFSSAQKIRMLHPLSSSLRVSLVQRAKCLPHGRRDSPKGSSERNESPLNEMMYLAKVLPSVQDLPTLLCSSFSVKPSIFSLILRASSLLSQDPLAFCHAAVCRPSLLSMAALDPNSERLGFLSQLLLICRDLRLACPVVFLSESKNQLSWSFLLLSLFLNPFIEETKNPKGNPNFWKQHYACKFFAPEKNVLKAFCK